MSTISLTTSANLQQALTAASPGDVLEVLPGSTYQNLVWPVKNDAAPVTIRTANIDNNVAPGTRVKPADAPMLAKIISTGSNIAAFATQAAAHGVVLCGLEICPADPKAAVSELVKLGDGSAAQNSLDKIPSNILLDRCYVHGLPGADLKRGISLQSALTTIRDSYISDCKGVGYDSQAVCGWNGPGPYKILNTYLEGAGENVMFGGADPYIDGMIPSDILIDACTFFKPFSWWPKHASYGGILYEVKNGFEIKNARRVVVRNSTFENCWAGQGQEGEAWSLKAVQQNGRAAWSACEDVQMLDNHVKNCGAGFNLVGQTNPVRNVVVARNRFEGLSGKLYGGDGWFCQLANFEGLTIQDNWSDQTGDIIKASGSGKSLVFTGNTLPHNAYGVKGDNAKAGLETLSKYFPGHIFTGNTIAGTQFTKNYPPGNTFVEALPPGHESPPPTPIPGPVVPPVGVPPVPVPIPIPVPIPPTGGQPVTINSSDPLSKGLVLAVPFYDKDAPFVTEEVSGQESVEGANGFVWQTPIDMPGTWGKYAVGVSQKTDCLKVSVYGDYWKAPPVAGFSAAACFKPTGTATSGVQRILDTDTIAGHVIYVDHDRNGPKLGWLTIMCSDAQGNPIALDFEYPKNQWLCVVKAVSMNLCTIYANWHPNTPSSIFGMIPIASHDCDLPRTWWGGAGQSKLPTVQCLMGTVGSTTDHTPNAMVAQLNIWNRALSAEEVQSYRDNPKSMFGQSVPVPDPGPVVVPPVVDPRDAQIAELTRQVSSMSAKLAAIKAALG